jgi:hypothetical protein
MRIGDAIRKATVAVLESRLAAMTDEDFVRYCARSEMGCLASARTLEAQWLRGLVEEVAGHGRRWAALWRLKPLGKVGRSGHHSSKR